MEVETQSNSALSLGLKSRGYVGCNDAKSTKALGDEIKSQETTTVAALKLQKVYRSYRTRRKLADTAVVAEELWWQAIDYVRLNHSTISFFNFSKPETAVSRWNRVSLNASKLYVLEFDEVGKGLSKDTKALKLAFQHWIEAIDPRHRYGHSLHFYYEEWSKANSGQPFFYWLDIGDGREVDLEDCPRSKLRQQCIKYLGPHEREHYEYIVVNGKFLHKQTGKLLDTTKGSKWIFVMSTLKELYAGEKKKGFFHHSSFLAGGATFAAGRLSAENGGLKSISAYSGHYHPTEETLDSFLSFLKENGVSLDEVEILYSEGYESYEDNRSIQQDSNVSQSTDPVPSQVEVPDVVQEEQPTQLTEVAQSDNIYKRTLSGGIRSPKSEVPKKAILERINSKKTSSYQLGHQLSFKWCSGTGPRIGCVADYPMELRVQALDFVKLSPRLPPTPSFPQVGAALSPLPSPTSDVYNGGVSSNIF
ncbi:hypothetical protein GIB67_018998 [Kingdonia uniflora]|uniref:Uncharacterized protein n=1 Tax=Kingdonia uniflora TaxID=39325 RepID=A0A7J7MZ44_9MAGN|nr:hypothetical protein GIB67_018998 [Kingdonia uniflora]